VWKTDINTNIRPQWWKWKKNKNKNKKTCFSNSCSNSKL